LILSVVRVDSQIHPGRGSGLLAIRWLKSGERPGVTVAINARADPMAHEIA